MVDKYGHLSVSREIGVRNSSKSQYLAGNQAGRLRRSNKQTESAIADSKRKTHHIQNYMNTTTTIEFVDSNEADNLISPWAKPKKKITFEDHLIKPEYQDRRLRFSEGNTWLRIVPAIQPTAFDWCMPLQVLNFPGGRFTHPKTFKSSARSVFDTAYSWIFKQLPHTLYSKANKEGIRLLPDPMCLFWALLEIEGKWVARLILASNYDATRGGAPGLGHSIWRAVREIDETGARVSDPINAENGLMICIEKTKGKDSKYPSYAVRVGRQPAPLQPILDQMEPEERAVLTPIENVIRQLSPDEQWACLAKVIAQEHVDNIRASIVPAA